eukprot:12644835-Prorocentrum_lima.AAC.1
MPFLWHLPFRLTYLHCPMSFLFLCLLVAPITIVLCLLLPCPPFLFSVSDTSLSDASLESASKTPQEENGGGGAAAAAGAGAGGGGC